MLQPEHMIPVIQEYIKQRKDMIVDIRTPQSNIELAQMLSAYNYAIQWFELNKNI